MATGCAQYTGEGGDGGAETMATQADGEGCLSLKEQEPLLKLMTCVIFSQTTTSFLTSKKTNVAMPLRRGGESNRVAMTLCIMSVCRLHIQFIQYQQELHPVYSCTDMRTPSCG